MSKADVLAKLVSTGGILADGAITPAKISALHTDGGTMNGAITFANTQTWPTFNQSTTGNAATANKWTTARTLSLGGDATGNVSIDGSADATLTVAVADDSHNHTSSSGNFSVGGNLSVTGNLTINGTTTTFNSTVTTIDDPVITLGGDTAPLSDDSKDRGIEFRWHNGSAAKTGFFGFDDSTGYMMFIPDATNTSEIFSGTLGDIQATNFRGALFGNANTATTLQTARTINGVSFNGSSDITVADSTKLPLAGGTMTGAISFAAGQTWPTFNQNTTGSAATLTTARTINGVSFNGSANITVADSTKLPLAGGTLTGVTLVKRNLGTNDYTNVGQHNLHLRLQRNSDLKTIELGVLDNGTGVIQANESGVGYNSLALNPVSGAVTINGSIALHTGNYSSYALPLSGGTLTGPTKVKAGHGDTRFQLHYNHDNNDNSGYAGYLTLWASEPGLSYAETGIGGNINIGGQYYGRQSSGQPYGTYIRFVSSTGQIIFYSTTGVPNQIGGQGSVTASIDAVGNFTATNNVTAYSDERLKTNWTALPKNFITQLALVKNGTYTRIDTGARQAGSSAQDWQKLLPEVVMENNDDAKTLALAYGNAALVSAVELAKRVVDQETRIQQLETIIKTILAKD
jgi:hypothetical protein